jgi:F-box protein 9
MDQTEEELEKFRQKWKDEVTAKKLQNQSSVSGRQGGGEASGSSSSLKKTVYPHPVSRPLRNLHDEEFEPRSYHDLEEKEVGRKVGDDSYGSSSRPEPKTALEHYERAVEKEDQGSLGDSLSLYRKAFKVSGLVKTLGTHAKLFQLDDRVHERYKDTLFPSVKQRSPNTPDTTSSITTTAVSVPNAAHRSLSALPPSLSDLISQLSGLSIVGESAPTELSPPPPCPIAQMPHELLVEILQHLATMDMVSLAKVSLVCKRFAFLVFTEDQIWRRLAHDPDFGFPAMHYRYACSYTGNTDGRYILWEEDEENAPSAIDPSPLVPTRSTIPRSLPLSPTYPNYRQMFRLRPRVRFHGCYISTVNYNRPGNASSITWSTPIFIVTYYRYLRFFPDGSLISLLTTAEPADVVPYLRKEHLHYQRQPGGSLPQTVMKDALTGRWRLSGDPWRSATAAAVVADDDAADDTAPEPEGDVYIETQGVVPKYTYKLQLALGSAGRGARNNKLAWKGYWSHNKLTDDWAEFGRKNYRAFYWSRVKSYC